MKEYNFDEKQGRLEVKLTLYLKQDILLNGFEVIITKTGQPVKDKIFDNDFLHEFSDSKTHSAQLMIYFRYE